MDRKQKIDVTDAEESNYVDAIAQDTGDSALTIDPVDQVIKEDSDKLLAAEDEALERQFDVSTDTKSWMAKVKGFPGFWWRSKRLKYWTLFIVFASIGAASLIPVTRYAALNAAGVRVESSLRVVDSMTGLPLRNIPVSLQGQDMKSDDNGDVAFSDLKVGDTNLVIGKVGYAVYEREHVLGLGSNPLGDQQLVATGTQFTFILTDWLSGQPLVDAKATSGEDTAQSDDEGKITLTVGELAADTTATVVAEGYREEQIMLSESATEEDQLVAMAPSKKHVFVSNRNGQYDLYKIDVDGKNEAVLLAATGKEREIPHVQPHQTKHYAAYISTRDGEINAGGFIYDGLFIVDVRNGMADRIARSEQVQIIGWSGDSLVYTAVTEGVSDGNPERSKVYSYDVITRETTQLATSNYFNDVKLVNDQVFYSVSSFAVPASAAKLFVVNPDGEGRETVVDMQVWTIVQAAFDTLHFRAVDSSFKTQWLTKQGTNAVTQLEAPPVTQNSRFYSVSPSGDQALWVDERDGKGVLLNYTVASGAEEPIQTAPGLADPVYWLNDRTVIYRVATNQETADYILSLDGGEPRKIADVIGNRSRYFY